MVDNGMKAHRFLKIVALALVLIAFNNNVYARYIEPDPLGATMLPDLTMMGQGNIYSYSLNNPLRYVDPSGTVVLVDDAALLTLLTLSTSMVAYLESPQGQAMLAQNVKHIRRVLDGLINNAQEHVGKCPSEPPDGWNQNKWREEIKASLGRAKNLARRLPGKLQKQYLEVINTIEKLL